MSKKKEKIQDSLDTISKELENISKQVNEMFGIDSKDIDLDSVYNDVEIEIYNEEKEAEK